MSSFAKLTLISRTTVNASKLYSTNSGKNVAKNILRNPTKEELQWRTPWHKKPNEFYSKFKLFSPDKPGNAKILQFLQSDFDFRPSSIRNWFRKKRQEMEDDLQKLNVQRLEILGSELAAAHFIVHRGGSVKFYNDDTIYKRNENGDYDLPPQYNPHYVVEEIHCENVPINYDGLENFNGLKKIKRFSVNGCEPIDDWCLDRISGQFHATLEELDVRNCPNISSRGLEALYRISNLKLLYVDKVDNKTFEMVCLLLEELFPKLEIKYN